VFSPKEVSAFNPTEVVRPFNPAKCRAFKIMMIFMYTHVDVRPRQIKDSVFPLT
jgi:hypothetical protein